ncbi:MAG: hypothetical protein A2504_02575 [Bdellovibrionales bacterium RIFOXYD12_FULL_39_22]|nr:MAG: hypothetical protein A2385_12605 [Bdellovibrionales bacterium RIFOXYB1_FULL_39_21]OFZ41189.1 MAG: hypothetical protein A2485_01015 [Bdellovibrionales bacterium RIFOXYC12_FULL_39_17]OFZ44943.1 MAG: hypothetical protein A2404_11760 [Bdellovibrionales bacterium RIFOXYC1_FULL_39_130]OFZ74390.1 MAG: hypothetical protein A2560_12130 [Bdellovibrionales bacterium RIFOXYD1_FULL_39_84]OFZ74712.1 MAG: hypothetical protein A2451_09880 [Bdellovibrionales bacterium RIFOXYC2_FULL_39_8]OFZ92392.1 MAG:
MNVGKMKVGGKINAAFLVMIFIFVVVMGISIMSIDRLIEAFHVQMEHQNEIFVLKNLEKIGRELTLLAMDVIVKKEKEKVWEETDVDFLDIKKRITVAEEEIDKLKFEMAQKQEIAQLKELIHSLAQTIEQELRAAIVGHADNTVFAALDEKIDGFYSSYLGKSEKIVQTLEGEIEIYTAKVQEQEKVITLIITLGFMVFAIAMALSFFLNSSVKKVGQLFLTSVESITNTSAQIASGNQELSSRTQEQASSLEETASTLEEITSTVKQTTDNAQRASQLSSQAVLVANDGNVLSTNVQQAMSEIASSSGKIAEIVNLVEEISFQTNILAINAAIEAAKAGEQGKGFAVVAIEVRDLAQRSSEAAKDIKSLIDNSLDKVKRGAVLVTDNANKLKEITSSIQQVSDIMGEISAASKEQYAGIEQINKAVMELDSVTQQNSSLVEEISASSENLSTDARQMKILVTTQLADENGGRQKSKASVSTPTKEKKVSHVEVRKKEEVVVKAEVLSSAPKKTEAAVPAPAASSKAVKKASSGGEDVVESILAQSSAGSLDNGEDF